MVDGRAGQAGSGPLYERGDAGRKAAEEPVAIPGSGDAEADADTDTSTGTDQAAADRAVEPPG